MNTSASHNETDTLDQHDAWEASRRWFERWGHRAAYRRKVNCPWPKPKPD